MSVIRSFPFCRTSMRRSPHNVLAPAYVLLALCCLHMSAAAQPPLPPQQPALSAHAPGAAPENNTTRTEPHWHKTMRLQAAEHGYRLLDLDAVDSLPETTLLLDVRPDYEFAAGHVPGAVNMEFDPGDTDSLSAEKTLQLQQTLGPDKERMVVIYCRSFRCLRSGAAAKAAARLGYTNVWRVVEGYFGWLEQHRPDHSGRADGCSDRRTTQARTLPDHGLAILGGDADRRILGLPAGAHTVRLEEIPCDVLVVLFFNTHCTQCREQMQQLEHLARTVNSRAATQSHRAVAFAGIGVRESKRTLARLRRKQVHAVPLFADPDASLFAASGFAGIPGAWVIGPAGGKATDSPQTGGRAVLLSVAGDIAQNPEFRSLIFRMTNVPAWGISGPHTQEAAAAAEKPR
ncbi:Rhodanese-like protein [Oleidesulfovibrio alaskensis G20]|uniref:Rhodanese-like protein n=1 Tax=Oleidesulfovibrio alaskensis (strain ATCC BAA-1058 / DSM 17464 / G20) TaxID=207559 RepID=Q315B7_OLEA2|nr:rhodanese-like domain-containing protein [Oleidesulfovibrio alaskensis]ABB37479.1 Rhodanese-like protein [Oleidesulfovibrio alaskensis G20]MBG0774658.1 redoxin domain-containing protein [Oleidesulfovibrio alaskensis]